MNKKNGIVTIALIFFILISSITVVFASLIKEEISSTKMLSTIDDKKIKQTGNEIVAEMLNDKEVKTKISNLQAITISNETIKKLANVNKNMEI